MFWLGGRDSNPDSQIQSLESYHWTTSQRRIRIYGSLTFKSTEPFKRGGLCFNLYAPLRVPRYFAAVTSKKVLALRFVSKQNSRAAGNPHTCRFFTFAHLMSNIIRT